MAGEPSSFMYCFVFLKIRVSRGHVVANHQQRILPVVLILALSHAQLHKAQALIQALRPQVAAPNLQRGIGRP